MVAHEDFDEDLLERVSILDASLPALKKEVQTLKVQTQDGAEVRVALDFLPTT